MIISRKRFEAEIARRVEEESRRIWDNERYNRLAERMDKLEGQLAEIKFRVCDAEIDNHINKRWAVRMKVPKSDALVDEKFSEYVSRLVEESQAREEARLMKRLALRMEDGGKDHADEANVPGC